MRNIFLDTESAGLYGQPILLQYAINDGDVVLVNLFEETIQSTIDLIESFFYDNIIGYNVGFDIYKIIQFYTTFIQVENKQLRPKDIPHEKFLRLEANGINQGCLKFKGVVDTMLVGLQDKLQELLFKKRLTIRKVPKLLVDSLMVELGRIKFPDLYFAKYVDPKTRWKIVPLPREKDFVDVQIKFRPSSKMKDIITHLKLSKEKAEKFEDVTKLIFPEEFGFRPYGWCTEQNIKDQCEHWYKNDRARKYARNDVEYTREIYKFLGCPETNDVNSVLTSAVASCRWKGFSIDKEKMEKLKQKYLLVVENAKVNFDAPKDVFDYVSQGMTEMERMRFNVDGKISCAKEVLEEIEKMTDTVICPKCQATELDCPDCLGEGYIEGGKHPSAIRATEVLECRKASKRADLLDKFIRAGRFHPTFSVMGTLSSRMSGSGDGSGDQNINAQGIPREKEFRGCFPLANPNEKLCIGDFDSFEIAIMCANYNDEKLLSLLRQGKKVHGIFASFLYDMSYEKIMETKGTLDDLYTKGKTAVFALCYGGQAYTIAKQTGTTVDQAQRAYDKWFTEFPNFKIVLKNIEKELCLVKSDGQGFRFDSDVKDHVESMLGFKRYFRIEHKFIKALWDVLQDPPASWKENEFLVLRKESKGLQTLGNAMSSALYAFMFSLQSGMVRAGLNHKIQSTGSQITKSLQVKLWDLQPVGYNPWEICLMNIHDELASTCRNEDVAKRAKDIVDKFVHEHKKLVPMLEMDYGIAKSWAEKK